MTSLIGDIGGTHARFALAEGGVAQGVRKLRLDAFPGLAEAALAYLDGRRVARIMLAAAGPIAQGRIRLTNRDWLLDPAALCAALGAPVELLNDFAALALSLPHLAAEDLLHLGGGRAEPDAPRAVLGPGTGLGVAGLLPGGVVLPTEGGHITLAAADEREASLLARLRARHAPVSAESVLSGPGLALLHGAIAEHEGAHVPQRDAAAVLAARQDCPVAAATVAQFLAFLGGFAGDVALMLGARGGVFLGGGILPRIADALPASQLRPRFEAKGRMSGYVEPIPLAAILRDDAALKGLAARETGA